MDKITLFRSPFWYLRQTKKCYIEFVKALLYNNAFGNNFIIKMAFGFWVIFCILLVTMMVQKFIRQKTKRGSIAFAGFAIFCLPIASLLFYLTSDEIRYHILMKESIALCWVLPVMCIDQALVYNEGKLVREIMTGMLLIILGNTAVGTNILYLSLYTSYEKTYALENRIVYKIEEINTENLKGLYIHENVNSDDYSDQNFEQVDIDGIATKNGIIPYVYYTHVFFINQYIGGNYRLPTGEQIADIKATAEFATMPVWPEEGAVQIINNVIVVNLGN